MYPQRSRMLIFPLLQTHASLILLTRTDALISLSLGRNQAPQPIRFRFRSRNRGLNSFVSGSASLLSPTEQLNPLALGSDLAIKVLILWLVVDPPYHPLPNSSTF